MSSMACARTINALMYLMRKHGHYILCYLDDFVGAAATPEAAWAVYIEINDLASQLGLDLATHKCVPPTQRLIWLGFHL